MADRGWFSRVRTAHAAQQQAQQAQQSQVPPNTNGEAGDRAQHVSLHRSLTQVPLQQNPHHKPPKLGKISSFIGLGSLAKAQSPTVAPYPELVMERSESIRPGAAGHHITSVDGGGPVGDWQAPPKEERDFPKYKASRCTWENPSLKQMVETVSCTMMKNGSSAPIPRHLNGWIAGMMEEVSHQTRELDSLRVEIAELKETRQQEVIEFSKVTEEWAQREKDFKAEINRLEHIISDTQQGAESVMLARAGSVVNRNDGRAFRAKLDRLSRSDEGDANSLEDSRPMDRERDYLVEQDRRDCVALSPGDVGLTINTTPYDVPGSTPSRLDHNPDVHLSRQLRDTAPRCDRKQDQNISAKLVAARVSLQTTGKPPAPSARNSNESSSQSSSGNASCSSSLITQGLAKVAQAKVTPHTSPTKDENLCGRPVEELKEGGDVLETIRQLAAQNGGLPDAAIDDDSSCSSSAAEPRAHRAFSFSAGDDKLMLEDETTSAIAGTSTNVASTSRRSEQLSAVQEQPLDSQLDGASRFSTGAPLQALGQQSSDSSSSDTSQRRSHVSMLESMGYNHATKANKEKAIADERKKLEAASVCSPMIVAMARERSVPSPSKKVHDGQVPRQSHRARFANFDSPQSLAFISDEELALAPNRQANDATGVRPQGHTADLAMLSAVKRLSTDVSCNQEAAFTATRTLERSTSSRRAQKESHAQAA